MSDKKSYANVAGDGFTTLTSANADSAPNIWTVPSDVAREHAAKAKDEPKTITAKVESKSAHNIAIAFALGGAVVGYIERGLGRAVVTCILFYATSRAVDWFISRRKPGVSNENKETTPATGTLEQRIAEQEALVLALIAKSTLHTQRWSVEEETSGTVRICRGLHDKALGCEWEYYTRSDGAAG